MDDALGSNARAVAVGAASGALATAAMSALMVAAREAGLMSELPPHVIAQKTVERTDTAEAADPDEKAGLGWLAHFAFGAAAGALYAPLRARLPAGVPAALTGAVFALGIWAVSYQGWIPALRFLPPATRDEPGRPPTMVAAHLVFGAVMGLAAERGLRRA